MDALGVETSGTIAQLAFLPVGEPLKRGEAFGSLEAAKFVGPLTSPLSGTVAATNDAVVADPALVERDPYGAGWLVEIDLADPAELGNWSPGADADPRLVRGRGRGLPAEGGAGRMTAPVGRTDGRVRLTAGELRRHHRVLRPRPQAVGDPGVEADQPPPVPARLGHRVGLRPVLRPLPGEGSRGDDLGQGGGGPVRPRGPPQESGQRRAYWSPAVPRGRAACPCSATSSTSPGSRTNSA